MNTTFGSAPEEAGMRKAEVSNGIPARSKIRVVKDMESLEQYRKPREGDPV